MHLPKDPVMLMSVINTRLRDGGGDLDALCADLEIERAALERRLADAGFTYCVQTRQFR